MGLRTASVRRPYVEVMAPALTETTQPQALKLPPKVDGGGLHHHHNHHHHHHVHPASPLNGFEARGKFLPDVHGSTCFQEADGADAPAVAPLGEEGSKMSEEQRRDARKDDDDHHQQQFLQQPPIVLVKDDHQQHQLQHQHHHPHQQSQNVVMGQDEKQQRPLDGLTSADFPQNVDELMQVIKSFENATETEAAVPNSDLMDELPGGLDLLADVDMMNMSMEEENAVSVKETQSKDFMAELERRQARLERRLDIMRRKVHKFQVRQMGQHASGEVAGVFEYVHRGLKRLKDNGEPSQGLLGVAAATGAVTPPSSTPAIAPGSVEDPSQCGSGGGVSLGLGGNLSIGGIGSVSVSGSGSDRPKPMSLSSTKAMVKKLEMTTVWQANSASRQKHSNRYFGAGSLEPARCGNVPGVVSMPPWPQEHKQELQKVAGLLRCELGVVQRELDSEATDSSSGGESCDEMQNYNNPHQQYLTIQKRALWRFLTSRATIAAKWSWLQAQITDLEYRIRTYTDFHRQIRTAKGTVTLGGASPPRCNGDNGETPCSSVSSASATSPTTINGFRGQLPSGTNGPLNVVSKQFVGDVGAIVLEAAPNGARDQDYECARTRPLVNFRKRKLLQTNGLHLISKKAARPSTVRCGCGGCVPPAVPCALCTGRTDPTHPRDPPDALSKAERIALVDSAFHPVFSLDEDVSIGIHCDAIMKMPDWQQRSTRMKPPKSNKGGPDRLDKSIMDHRKVLDHRKKFPRLKPSTASALSAKIKNKIRGRKSSRYPSSTSGAGPSTSSQYRINRKRSSAKMAMAQMHALATDMADEEVESIGNSSHAATNSAMGSPSSSPLFHMQTISGYSRRNRANSYDIDNIVIPYSVAASTRVEKLQYKEILTPKWRIADPDFKCDTKNNGAVRNPSQDSDAEDLSEDAVVTRHDKCEHEEKKKFLSYLKLPLGHSRSRAHKRTDSLAESSGANTPDAMSPHPVDMNQDLPVGGSPLISPPATPLPTVATLEDSTPLPSVAVMRRRTVSQSRFARERETTRDDNSTPEHMEVAPFDTRTFPLEEEIYSKMMDSMPENSQLKTNDRAQDSIEYNLGYLDEKVESPCESESTESAMGEEDPNDPEWVDMERSRDRHKR